jgi:HSP20 family molecular chaperone IbpA
MPLTPKYSWSETADAVAVHVHVPGASKSTPDILVADCVLKVNAPPYLLVLDLHGEVDQDQSTAKMDAHGITFQLRKAGRAELHACMSQAPAPLQRLRGQS